MDLKTDNYYYSLLIIILVYNGSYAFQNDIEVRNQLKEKSPIRTRLLLLAPLLTISDRRNLTEVSVESVVPDSIISNSAGVIGADQIEFNERKMEHIINSRIHSNVVPTIGTGRSTSAALIHYPNFHPNPSNRLPLEPEEIATLASVLASSTPRMPDPNEFTPENMGIETTPSTGNPYEEEEWVKSMDVTLDIVKHSRWEDGNAIFSPLSVCNVLALFYLGSDGITSEEIASTLRLSNSRRGLSFHRSFNRLRKYLNKRKGKNMSLEIANQIFTDSSFQLKDSYIEDAHQYYDTPVQSFGFRTDGELFKEMVNQWVVEKTNGKINTIVDQPPSPGTTLAMVNAVYFKGSWENPFMERITRSAPFYVQEGETLNVQMMTNVMTVPYFENSLYKMAAIPYKGNQTALFVILPQKGSVNSSGIENLKNLESRLSLLEPKDLLTKLNEMQLQKVSVKLPKMKLSADGQMKEVLSRMGLTSMFHPHFANFSKISQNEGLFVSQLLHRAVVEINERGTEAAAVSLATGDRIIDDLPIPFVANKPFMFFIYHIRAKSVLFWGRVTRPEWS